MGPACLKLVGRLQWAKGLGGGIGGEQDPPMLDVLLVHPQVLGASLPVPPALLARECACGTPGCSRVHTTASPQMWYTRSSSRAAVLLGYVAYVSSASYALRSPLVDRLVAWRAATFSHEVALARYSDDPLVDGAGPCDKDADAKTLLDVVVEERGTTKAIATLRWRLRFRVMEVGEDEAFAFARKLGVGMSWAILRHSYV